jgi:hypothetical protein
MEVKRDADRSRRLTDEGLVAVGLGAAKTVVDVGGMARRWRSRSLSITIESTPPLTAATTRSAGETRLFRPTKSANDRSRSVGCTVFSRISKKKPFRAAA